MKFALYSDLHVELMHHQSWKPEPLDVDVVILAGDIGMHTRGLSWANKVFQAWPNNPQVIYVAGNHEYYEAGLDLLDDLRRPTWQHVGLEFLEQDALQLPGVRILGCTLWSKFDLYGGSAEAMALARNRISDYWLIRNKQGKRLEPQDTLELHHQAVAWLDAELAQPYEGRTLVVTHFAPHRGCVAPQHEGNLLTSYFVTDLSWLMEKHSIDVWCHGHTHTSCDFIAENGCRVISNQRGYLKEVEAGISGFRPNLVFEI